MNLPHFLIIGAMKSGTTTLFADLRQHPSLFFPSKKEPHFFCTENALTEKGLQAYAKLFEKARPNQLCAEASTGYAKLPTYDGVPERAKRVLGTGLKAIYIVRDPVDRAISHHHHMFVEGKASEDINQAVLQCDEIISYSRYAYQITPWIESVGRKNILIIRFEDYVSHRQTTCDRICDWLGIEHQLLNDPKRQLNKSKNKPYLAGYWRNIAGSRLYRGLVRPLLPFEFRQRAFSTLLPKGPSKLKPPSDQTLRILVDSFRDDVDRISKLIGLTSPAWDLEKHLRVKIN